LGPAWAQSWSPTRPIRLIAPYAPGGGVDTAARLLAPALGAVLGVPIIVENRAGAGGAIGAAEVARSAPDGHTLMVDALAHTVNPALMRGLAFDYATAFAPISRLLIWPQLLVVRPDFPARSLAEFVAYARARPGALSYGSSGNATAAHLAAALLVRRAGLELTHIPYRGGGPALQDLLAGQLAFVFATVASSAQLVQDGRLRALACSSAQRLAAMPAVPTVAEQGFPGYALDEWNGLYAPAGLPPAAALRWHAAAVAALADPGVRGRLEALGAITLGTDPEGFARFVATEREAMARLVHEARIELS